MKKKMFKNTFSGELGEDGSEENRLCKYKVPKWLRSLKASDIME